MAHGSGVISGPTGGAQRGDNGNNATGRCNGEGGGSENGMLPGPEDAAQRGGATERGSGNGMLPGPADAAQQGRCNEGRATVATRRKLPMKTTQRTGRFAPSGFFAPFCGMAQKFRTAHAANSDGFFNFAYRYPNSESNQNDIPVL